MSNTPTKVPARQAGFTLIEIAVVLVIVGLLIGGVMKGQEMINSAKVKNLGQDLRNVGTFATAYQDKYRSLPGDDNAAVAHVSGTAASTGGTLGNGLVEGNWNSTTRTDESYLFWQHIRLAGLANGATDTTSAEYLPKTAMGSTLGVTSADPTSGTGAPAWNSTLFSCTSNINGSVIRQLDTTMDDGNTITGSVRAVGSATNLTSANDATKYTVCMSF